MLLLPLLLMLLFVYEKKSVHCTPIEQPADRQAASTTSSEGVRVSECVCVCNYLFHY